MKPELRLRSTLIAALIWLLGQQFGVCFYEPSTGRWLSRDPIEESQGPNIYASVFNSPSNLADSDGRQAFAVTAEYTFSGRRPSQVPSITPADIANGIQRPLDYLQNAALNTPYLNQSTLYNFAILNNFAIVNGPLDTLRFQFVLEEFLVRNASRDQKVIGCCRETARGLGLALLFAPTKGRLCQEKPPIIRETAAKGGVLENANFAQRTFRQTFNSSGTFGGRTVGDVAAALRSGEMSAADVAIQYIVRDGNALILNTRSAQALQQAGIPRAQWNAINMTGDAAAELRLTAQLQRNGLTSQGIPTVVPTGH